MKKYIVYFLVFVLLLLAVKVAFGQTVPLLNWFEVSTYSDHLTFQFFEFEDHSHPIGILDIHKTCDGYVIDEIVDVMPTEEFSEDEVYAGILAFGNEVLTLLNVEFDLILVWPEGRPQDLTPENVSIMRNYLYNTQDNLSCNTLLPLILN